MENAAVAPEGAMEEFDFDSIVLRRADPDDCDAVINLVEIGEDDIYNRVYSYPKILKLIETAYIAITAVDREGRVVAFAAFEDYPPVSVHFVRSFLNICNLCRACAVWLTISTSITGRTGSKKLTT